MTHNGALNGAFNAQAALASVNLPKRIARMADLVYNLWWTWNTDVTEVFESIDRQLWADVAHNPIKFLRRVKRQDLNGALQRPAFLELFDRVISAFDTLHEGREHLVQTRAR